MGGQPQALPSPPPLLPACLLPRTHQHRLIGCSSGVTIHGSVSSPMAQCPSVQSVVGLLGSHTYVTAFCFGRRRVCLSSVCLSRVRSPKLREIRALQCLVEFIGMRQPERSLLSTIALLSLARYRMAVDRIMKMVIAVTMLLYMPR